MLDVAASCLLGGVAVPLFETLRNALPRSLFTHLGEPARAIEVPARVGALIRAREEESERLIGWVQLVMAATFAALYVIAPRPLDAGMSMLAPVPLALTGSQTRTSRFSASGSSRVSFAHGGVAMDDPSGRQGMPLCELHGRTAVARLPRLPAGLVARAVDACRHRASVGAHLGVPPPV